MVYFGCIPKSSATKIMNTLNLWNHTNLKVYDIGHDDAANHSHGMLSWPNNLYGRDELAFNSTWDDDMAE